MVRILIVEDELQMRRGLQDNLEFEGYEVDFAGDGRDGLDKIEAGRYNLILLDVMLPKMSGFDVCREIRRRGVGTPVIMLTAKGEEIDKVLGLELGADDYITKPFSLRELLARIKAVLRRADAGGEDTAGRPVQMGRITVNFATYEATVDGHPVSMSHREVEILNYFLQHKNQVVSRDQLLEDVWGYDQSITTRTVDNFILKLRQKLEEDPARPRHILTVHGVGYKFIFNH